jgi:hypothetical protein
MYDLITKIRILIEDSQGILEDRIEDLELEVKEATSKIRQLKEDNEAILDEYSWLEYDFDLLNGNEVFESLAD